MIIIKKITQPTLASDTRRGKLVGQDLTFLVGNCSRKLNKINDHAESLVNLVFVEILFEIANRKVLLEAIRKGLLNE